MTCDCIPQPPILDFGPPPDPSLIWHLLSEEPFEKIEDCEWNPFVSISDVSPNKAKDFDFERLSLLFCALAAVLLFCIICTLFALRIRRRNAEKSKKKTASSDHILTAADNLWSYNSMKTTNNSQHGGSLGVLMYGGSQCGGSMVFHKTVTPGSTRSFHPADKILRQSATTLRLHPDSGNYHTVGRHYEEIPSQRGTLPHHSTFVPPPQVATSQWPTPPRGGSIRKPPPTCRPPPPPQNDDYVCPDYVNPKFHSPVASDSSIEHELAGINADSPPMTRWNDGETRSRLSGENGRESGYGTAPSRQWRSPPSSDGRNEAAALALSQTPNAHNMTYV